MHHLIVPLLCFAFNAFVIFRDSKPVPETSAFILPIIKLTWQSLAQVLPYKFGCPSEAGVLFNILASLSEHLISFILACIWLPPTT
jgi:hypothetical protein